MGSFDFYHIYAGNICTYTFFYQSVNFYLIKKNQKPLKIKMWLQFFNSYSLLSCHSFGGREDTAVYETGFFFFYLTKLFIEKSRITVFNIHA